MYVAQLKECDAVIRSEVFEKTYKFSLCTLLGKPKMSRCLGEGSNLLAQVKEAWVM